TLRSWAADFTQETYSVGLGRGTFQSGRFHFQAPDKIRYSLNEPEASDFISNGKEAWLIRYPKGRKAKPDVSHYEDMKSLELDRYLLLLRGIDTLDPQRESKLTATFAVSSKVTDTQIALTFEPRKASEITKMELVFPQKQVSPEKAIIEDAVG